MSYIGNTPLTTAFLTNTFSGNASTTVFTMSVAPANTTSVLVAVSGVVQDPSTYSVSGTTLTFSAAPPTGTNNISVRFLGIPASGVTNTAYRTVTSFTATSGQTSFSVPSYTAEYINVYRNGVRLDTTDYTASSGTTVVLNNGCTTGDTVVIESFYVSSVLNAIPATAGSVGTTYIANNSITTDKIAAGAVIQADLATGVAGTGPTFSAYLASSGGSISSTTVTKCTFDTERWDTNNNFASSRFTPTVAGYYQINAAFQIAAAAPGFIEIHFNGAGFKRGAWNIGNFQDMAVSGLVYCNGSTDYVEIYLYQTSGSTVTPQGGASISWFDACLVRSA